jgi:hypothetical protein
LDESHAISQDVNSPSGSYWHAILHRREPDFSNAKYWFRRVGEHPVFVPLAAGARRLAGKAQAGGAAQWLLDGAAWDAVRFVDLCAAVQRDGSAEYEALCRDISWLEWQVLFDYCYREAFTSPAAADG